LIKNLQPFWKKFQKTGGEIFFDSHCTLYLLTYLLTYLLVAHCVLRVCLCLDVIIQELWLRMRHWRQRSGCGRLKITARSTMTLALGAGLGSVSHEFRLCLENVEFLVLDDLGFPWQKNCIAGPRSCRILWSFFGHI